MMPEEAIIIVTGRCNSKCMMCNLWKSTVGDELEPDCYKNLPGSLRTVKITGGEPFLREDLPAVIETIGKTCNNPRIVISTNGLLPETIERHMQMILKTTRKVGVRVSVDGLGKLDDMIRGVDGAYSKALKSLKVLKGLGIKDLGISFTIQDENVRELSRVYELSRRLGVEFTGGVVENSFRYGKGDNKFTEFDELDKQLDYVIRRELESWSLKRWFRAYYFSRLIDYAGCRHGSGSRKRELACTAVERFFLVSPNGDVHPCTLRSECIGNMKEGGVGRILDSKETLELSEKLRDCPIDCWTMCNVASAMKKNALSVVAWITENKFKVHFRWRDPTWVRKRE